MLTKNLLKHTLRKNKVFPHSLKISDESSLQLAEQMIHIFSSEEKLSEDELKDKVKACGTKSTALLNCFEKLLFDRSDFGDLSKDIEEKRWDVLYASEEMRLNHNFSNIQEFQQAMSESFSQTAPSVLTKELYSDLPQFRKIKQFKTITPIELIHRYNLAQIQGVILQAQKISIDIYESDLPMKRSLLRLIKFHQLIVEIEDVSKNHFKLEISGPLSIFDSGSSYGLKLANFVPYIFQFEKYTIHAEAKLKSKPCTLEIDQSHKIKSHYKPLKGYVPEVFKTLENNFNEKNKPEWCLSLQGSSIHIEGQNYSFADFVVTNSTEKNRKVHFELFHKWHAFQFQKRLEALEKSPKPIALGLCRALSKKKEYKEIIENSLFFNKHGFIFSDFPTSKQILASVKSIL